jgi:hypothetical protein
MANPAAVERILAIWIGISYGAAVVWCTLALTAVPAIHQNAFADFDSLKPSDFQKGAYQLRDSDVTTHPCDTCVAGLRNLNQSTAI